MKYKIFTLILIALCPLLTFAETDGKFCSKSGYTITTMNGIFTTEQEAKDNMVALYKKLGFTHNNQNIDYQYLYNQTNVLGVKDLIDAMAQKIFENQNINDYDMVEMLNDASQKVKTEKLLLVAHSQGNFYSNSFYNLVAGQEGGVPRESISVYGVASPASYVAGLGKYITSSTDAVINKTRVFGLLNVLPANTKINFSSTDDHNHGHGFGEVYLKYESARIISEIKSSLSQLKENNIQDGNKPCISAPKLDITHKIQGTVLTSADFVLNGARDGIAYVGKTIKNVGLAVNNALVNLFSNAIETLPEGTNSLTTLTPDILEPEIKQEEPLPKVIDNLNTEPETKEPVVETEETLVPEIKIPEIKTEEKTEEKKIEEIMPVVVKEEETKTITPEPLGAGGYVAPSDPPQPDILPPVITLLGNETEIVQKNTIYTDAGATALDEKDGNLTSNIIVTGITELNTSVRDVYNITYTVSDVTGNIATKIRKVIVDDGAKLDNPNFVTVSGNYAYVLSSNGNSFEIIDISNPETLVHKSSFVHNHDTIEMSGPKALAVYGNYAYVISGISNNLNVIDISNPLLPVIKSTVTHNIDGFSLSGPSAINIVDNYAYIVSGGGSLEIIDISNPLVPIHKGSLLGLLNRPTALSISQDHAYIVSSGDNSLKVINISDKTAPVLSSILYDGANGAALGNPTSIFVSGNYAYIGARENKAFEIVNISDPNIPVHVTKLTIGFSNPDYFSPSSIFVFGNYTYITSFVGESLEIVDVKDPNLPVYKKSLLNGVGGAALSYPTSIFVSQNYAFVSSQNNNALEVIDISNPLNPIHKNKIINGEYNHTDPILSAEKQISSFNFSVLTPEVVGTVDENNHTITLTVPFETDVSALVPNIVISANATVSPNNNISQNFSNPVTYIVTAQNGNTQNYIVTVNISPDPNTSSDSVILVISNYTFNGVAGDITINPTSSNPLNIVLTASKNVDWTSIKIENQTNSSIYKIFQAGAGCVNGTNTCTKSWNGTLSKGGLIQNDSIYRLKVHIKDSENNDFYDYLTPYVIKINFP